MYHKLQPYQGKSLIKTFHILFLPHFILLKMTGKIRGHTISWYQITIAVLLL